MKRFNTQIGILSTIEILVAIVNLDIAMMGKNLNCDRNCKIAIVIAIVENISNRDCDCRNRNRSQSIGKTIEPGQCMLYIILEQCTRKCTYSMNLM